MSIYQEGGVIQEVKAQFVKIVQGANIVIKTEEFVVYVDNI